MKALKLALEKDSTMLSYMDVFVRIASNREDVATAGEQFLFNVYGAEQFSTQNKFSHVAYYKRSVARTSTSNSFTLSSLPPTTAAAMRAKLIMGVSTGPAVVGGGICLPPSGGGKQGNTT